jgi:hypothetical protein
MRPVSPNDVAALLRPPARRLSSGEIRHRADLAALRMVAQYSHCTVSDFAATIYPHGKYAVQSAQRIAKRLVGQQQPPLLAERRNSLGGRSLVLTRPGAAFLEIHGTRCHHGMDLASVAGPTYRHHAITARFCQMQELMGASAWPEHAIGQGMAPLSQREVVELCGKIPDALVVHGATTSINARTVRAVETESARKSNAFIMKALLMAERARNGMSIHGFTLAGVTFVFDAGQDHAARIARVARIMWSPQQRSAFAPYIACATVTTRLPLAFGDWKYQPLQI